MTKLNHQLNEQIRTSIKKMKKINNKDFTLLCSSLADEIIDQVKFKLIIKVFNQISDNPVCKINNFFKKKK